MLTSYKISKICNKYWFLLQNLLKCGPNNTLRVRKRHSEGAFVIPKLNQSKNSIFIVLSNIKLPDQSKSLLFSAGKMCCYKFCKSGTNERKLMTDIISSNITLPRSIGKFQQLYPIYLQWASKQNYPKSEEVLQILQ